MLGAVEIGEGAGDAEHAVISARRELEALGGIEKKFLPLGIGRRDLIEELAVGLGVGADAALRGECCEALHLTRARLGDARGDIGAPLRRRRQGEIGGFHGGHVDMEVDAVEERAGDLRLVILRTPRRTAAPKCDIVKVPAAA